jgi:hypothetical protein
MLDPSIYGAHLPSRFHGLETAYEPKYIDDADVVAVQSNGALEISKRWSFLEHRSQWTGYSGRGGSVTYQDFAEELLKEVEGRGRRWTWSPWTREMEKSCRAR